MYSPGLVKGDEELIEANSKLQILGGVAGVVAAVPGGLLYLIGPTAVMVGCATIGVLSLWLIVRPRTVALLTP